MPNLFAQIVFYLSPLLVILLFRRLPLPTALVATVVFGYLFLPSAVGFKIPGLPGIDKSTLPSFVAAALCLFFASGQAGPRRRSVGQAPADAPPGDKGAAVPVPSTAFRSARGSRTASPATVARESAAPGVARTTGAKDRRATARSRRIWLVDILIVLFIFIGPLVTTLNNADPVFIGGRFLAGLRLYDAGSAMVAAFGTLLPFLLARRYLATDEAHVGILRVICVGALVYSLLILIEVRLSPQLNVWIYGFQQHSFAQHIRAGGFRPMVFLQHGLWVGIFMALSVLAALTLARNKGDPRRQVWLAVAAWLFLALFLSKTLGAFGIALMLIPFALFAGVRLQLLAAGALAFVVLFYPMLRGAGYIPVEQVYALAQDIDEDRAASLKYRLDNEDILLARANEKPLAGWGGWGRSRVYDSETGKDVSTTDGAWIIIIGAGGWLGYLAQFGLLTLPLLLLAVRGQRSLPGIATGGLCLLLATNLVDLIPNATLTPVTWLLAGAVMGRLEGLRKRVASNAGSRMGHIA